MQNREHNDKREREWEIQKINNKKRMWKKLNNMNMKINKKKNEN